MGNHQGNPNFRINKDPNMTAVNVSKERRIATDVARQLLRTAGEQMMKGNKPKAPNVTDIVDAEQMAVVGAGLLALANGYPLGAR